jgi:hypothetical protein
MLTDEIVSQAHQVERQALRFQRRAHFRAKWASNAQYNLVIQGVELASHNNRERFDNPRAT